MVNPPVRVLALDPYHGGSHRQFTRGLCAHSRHDITPVTLPPRHFKWRIRSAALSFAQVLQASPFKEREWDLLFTTSAMNSCELLGLLPVQMRQLPLVVYFHDHQLNYPTRTDDERDVHFVLTNWMSALSATEVWFNSSYTRTSFLDGMATLLRKMPDEKQLDSLARIEAKSQIQALGIADDFPIAQRPGPLHILWASRWEHDKRPDDLLDALLTLDRLGCDFKLTLLGQRFNQRPPSLLRIEERFASRIHRSEYIESFSDYQHALSLADVVVSTAAHEFFGVALMEATRAGCIPVVPARLVYPELYPVECLYDGTPADLAKSLRRLARLKAEAGTLRLLHALLGLDELTANHSWSRRAPELDRALLLACQAKPTQSRRSV